MTPKRVKYFWKALDFKFLFVCLWGPPTHYPLDPYRKWGDPMGDLNEGVDLMYMTS